MLRFAVSNSSRPSDGSTNPGNNLHVTNLNRKMDNNGLEAIFAKVGRVCPAVMCTNLTLTCPLGPKSIMHSRESRGFVFVTMETAEEAEATITALNSTDIMG